MARIHVYYVLHVCALEHVSHLRRVRIQWKPSCKTGSAKWVYDGICSDPEVFGCLMGLGGPPTFKMKKFTVDEFEKCLGALRGSVR